MKSIIKIISLLLLALHISHCSYYPLDNIPSVYHSKVEEALKNSEGNLLELETFLSKCNNEEIEGAAFLLSYMPERDLTTLNSSFLSENIKYAYLAHNQSKWKNEIPDSIFLNYVLPYVNIHERRDNWRKDFYQKFSGLVTKSVKPGEAAIVLNKNIWDMINVHYSPKRPKSDQSPYESIDATLASCTGLAIILVDACRSVGIPARFVGIPTWYNDAGNHSWVEVWDNGWHYIESVTSDTLDQAWFQNYAARANRTNWKYGIYAISYKESGLSYHNIFDTTATYLWAIDVTDSYTSDGKENDLIRLNVKVTEKSGGNRIAIKVQLLEEDKVIAEGFSRGENNDLNDILYFMIKQDCNYSLCYSKNGKIIKKDYHTNLRTEQKVEIIYSNL